MKKIDVERATNSLGQYARELEQEPLVLIEDGHAIAALMPIDDADLESIALSVSPKFQAVIEVPERNFGTAPASRLRR